MEHDPEIDLCDCFTVGANSTHFPPAVTTVNGGAGQVSASTSRLAGAKQVAVFGYSVGTVTSTSLQINAGDASTPIVGMLYPTTATGTFKFPAPVLIKGDANVSGTIVGLGSATIYYRKLS